MTKRIAALLLLSGFVHAGTVTTYYHNNTGVISIAQSGAVGGGPSVVYDASVSSWPATGASPYTYFNLTIGSCSNRFIAVGCQSQSGDHVTAVTVGGVSMTQSTGSFNSIYSSTIWSLVAPASGSQAITVTVDAGIPYRTSCGAVSFCNVDQSNPVEASTATKDFPGGAQSSATLTTSTFGDALFDSFSDGNNDSPLVTQPGQAAIYTNTTGSIAMGVSTGATTTAGTYTMGWGNLSGSPFSQSAIAIKTSP